MLWVSTRPPNEVFAATRHLSEAPHLFVVRHSPKADRDLVKHLNEGERHILLELPHKVARPESAEYANVGQPVPCAAAHLYKQHT